MDEIEQSQEDAYAMWKAFVDKRKAESLGDGVGLQCAECDKEIAYSERHWSMGDEDWYCVQCWGVR